MFDHVSSIVTTVALLGWSLWWLPREVPPAREILVRWGRDELVADAFVESLGYRGPVSGVDVVGVVMILFMSGLPR
jgi:hypothetical protein